MLLEKGKISSSQLIFLIVGFISSSSILLSFVEVIAKHDMWLTLIVGLVEGIIFALIYTTLAKRFPGKNLVQINDIIYGPYIGKIISIFYLFFLLFLLSANLRIIGDFFTTVVMPETPMVVFIVMITFVSGYAVKKGLEVISRCSVVLVVLLFIEILLTIILLIKDMDFNNFLPILDIPLKDFLKANHIIAVIPFGETVVFLMITAYVNKTQQITKSTIIAFFIAFIFLLLIIIRNTSVLGITGITQNYPSYQTVRLINIRNIITRLEIFNANGLIILMFIKISVLYYVTVLSSAQLLNLRTYSPLVIPIGLITIPYSFFIYDYFAVIMEHAKNVYPIFSLPFEIGIPLLSLVIAILKKLPKSEEVLK